MMKKLSEAMVNEEPIEMVISIIEQSGIDQLVLDHIHPTTSDKRLNTLLSDFQASFYNVLTHLEKTGHITIHGTKIRRVLNR